MALLVRLPFVRFVSVSLDPEEDPLIKWFEDLNFWNVNVRCRIRAAGNCLPLDVEAEFKETLKLPLESDTRNLFSKLINSCTGIPLISLGFCGCGYDDPDTCVGKILSLRLGRVQDRFKFKAVNIAFDPRAQFLIGARSVPYS
jgi:hypothetical protein